MKIREVTLQDIENLKAIGKQTFSETYASVNSEEHMPHINQLIYTKKEQIG